MLRLEFNGALLSLKGRFFLIALWGSLIFSIIMLPIAALLETPRNLQSQNNIYKIFKTNNLPLVLLIILAYLPQ